MITFEEIGIMPDVLKAVRALGFENPMPIQEKVIPALLNTKDDLIGLAQTGTGKTAAFGLPIVQMADPANAKPQALILAPTRELCQQITADMKDFSKYLKNLNIVAIYGGADMGRQIRALKKKAQIIVATPGRMNDLLNKRKQIDLSGLQTVILDESDEMLTMGFKEELDAILGQTPDSKRTLLFSATMPAGVKRISKNYMRAPIEITIGHKNAGAENVDHICYTVRSKDRYLALKRIVDYHPDIYGIIFCRTRLETRDIAEKLIKDGYNADALHGELSQAQREHIMHKFRIKNLQVLVATDVAARGLDVKDISHIINYNLPDDNDTYTHRSGRTGRAGKKGTSIVIVNLKEKYKIKRIESKLLKKFKIEPVPGGKSICEKQVISLVDKLQKIEVDYKEIDKFLPIVYEKLEYLNREDLIKSFVSLEFNRFLDYYKDRKDLNAPEKKDVRTDTRKKSPYKKGPRNKTGDQVATRAGKGHTGHRGAEHMYSRFYINLGFKDGLTLRDIIGLIKRCSRNRNIDIGNIDLMKTFSFFEADSAFAPGILSGFKGVEYNNKTVKVEITTKEPHPQQDFPHKKKAKKSHRKGYGKKKKFAA